MIQIGLKFKQCFNKNQGLSMEVLEINKEKNLLKVKVTNPNNKVYIEDWNLTATMNSLISGEYEIIQK